MAFLDAIFGPLLQFNPAFVIITMSILLSVLITIIYKLMTNQSLMKSLKEDIKKHQADMKKQRDNPKKMLEIQKKAMEKNMQYMMHSMKPTFVTFIPLILIFGWLNAHYTYNPIPPQSEFMITASFGDGASGTAEMLGSEGIYIVSSPVADIGNGKASWTLKGDVGDYLVQVEYEGKKYDKEVTISDSYDYAPISKNFKSEPLKSISIEMTKLRVFGNDFSIFGWHPGWLGVYIITSIFFSMGLRKLLKLY